MKEGVGKTPARGASVAQKRVSQVGQAWWRHHRDSALGSLRRLSRSPMQTLMTSLVVAIALALPATLYVMLDNVYRLGDRWDSSPKLSVYLHLRAQPAAIESLQARLGGFPEVQHVEYISADVALKQFQETSGFASALEALDDNPLPATLVVTPAANSLDPAKLQGLMAKIGQEGVVEEVQVDLAWVKKLKAMMALGQKIIMGLAALLGIGVLLAIGNTIRLEIENRRDEIVVIKLVGGTNGFVRRPLLYTGAWYGVLGGFLGCVLVFIAFDSLNGAVHQLAAAYHSQFTLNGLGASGILTLLLLGGGLGFAGAWVAVSRHISAIEPR